LGAQLNGKIMNNSTQIQTNFFLKTKKYIREKIKILLFFLISVFVIFLSFQFFSYYKINQIEKNSIIYYEAIDSENQKRIYELLDELSNKNDFYSILANLELIKLNVINNDYNSALEIYYSILQNKKLDKTYIAAISSIASYNFIEIQYNNSKFNFLKDIEQFISFIDDSLNNYKGIKLELKYLLAIAEIDHNKLSYKDFNQASDLYKLIMETENISSTIKERVNKIHEFQLYN
tara:strand:- start:7967 stop:8668 length:702 start_codon:yes stop_codon:yes gene_type:complete